MIKEKFLHLQEEINNNLIFNQSSINNNAYYLIQSIDNKEIIYNQQGKIK